MLNLSRYTSSHIQVEVPEIFDMARQAMSVDQLRQDLIEFIRRMEYETFDDYSAFSEGSIIRVRDCANVLMRIMTRRSEDLAEFSLVQAIHGIATDSPRTDLTPAFYAELLHLLLGIQGRGPGATPADEHLVPSSLHGREAALERSDQLDRLSARMERSLSRFETGLDDASVRRREVRRRHILKELGGSEADWSSWQWQTEHVLRQADDIARLVTLAEDDVRSLEIARAHRVPFGITPHYLSLMDDGEDRERDRSVRAQVIPPLTYSEAMAACGRQGRECLDFMKEGDTSPQDLITRRYPGICIFKPFNTCPQICVYCQRNWEIEEAMAPGALASDEDIARGLAWIRDHPAIDEVLITGGDPLAMDDHEVHRVVAAVADIPTVKRIRIGSRVPVTLPMRVTASLADLLATFRVPGKREVAVVTHVQHAYEVTPETVTAIDRLRLRGIPVYNQLVYTFYVSRRFEAVRLRQLLSSIGVEPYYTFNTKGKEETVEYRVPLARLLQEQKEEARLLPGLTRTDEAVYNVPGLGKSYLRARQHRDLISILPSGARLYEFHPWEKNISATATTHIAEDVPILEYLQRLDEIGENVDEYRTIWYYF